MTRTMNIPIFIPHNGCLNDCVFCNQRKISGKEESEELIKVREFIIDSIHSAKQRQNIEIAFFGGSFTGLDQKIQKNYLDLGKELVSQYNLKGIRMSTRPDYINDTIMNFLKNYPVTAIELGVQSLNEKVLIATKRNHSVESVYEAVKLIKEANIELGLQMMIGLPEDSYETMIETTKKIIELNPRTIRIYPTLVIKDTELEMLFNQGQYRPLTLREATKQVAYLLPLFKEAEIDVIRVGLQANENLNSGDYIAGPYHPAFKELVMDQILFDEVIEKLNFDYLKNEKELDETDYKGYKVLANRKLFNRLVGHKKHNKEAFDNLKIKIEYDSTLDHTLIQIRGVQGSFVFTPRF